jgi:plastocyanin
VMNESVVSGAGNTLGDVVVYISAGGAPSTAPSTAVTFDQKGCQYLPHVLPMQTGQPLEIKNDDQTSHNIHPMSQVNPEWNKSQPPGAPPIQVTYAKAEFIPVKCNVHPWMHGYFAVLNTSHSTVSGADGSYSLSGLPPGKYTVTAWQERFGTQSQEVTIAGSETAKLDFSLKATEY